MRPVMVILAFLSVVALGAWAYRENYETQAALRELRALQADIVALHEGLAIQRAEWAYLNRPDRLRELAAANFDRLQLLPMDPSQFGRVVQIARPGDLPALNFDGATDVAGEDTGAGEAP
jgi:hypothetical protein